MGNAQIFPTSARVNQKLHKKVKMWLPFCMRSFQHAKIGNRKAVTTFMHFQI